MSEQLTYSRDIFPIAGVLEDLTGDLNTRLVAPTEALVCYNRRYVKQLGKNRGGERYCSTSVTTGGHARRSDLDKIEKVRRNTGTARRTLAVLATRDAVNPKTVVNPVDLGYVKGWSQVEFMKFWLGLIGGLDLGKRSGNQSEKLYERTLQENLETYEVDLANMTDDKLSSLQRAPEYFRFAQAHFATTDTLKGKLNFNPVNEIVSLVDPDMSLGCQTERIFGRMCDIPTYKFAPAIPGTLEDMQLPGEFRQDLDEIVRFGAAVCILAEGPMFGMVEQTNDNGLVVASAGQLN